MSITASLNVVKEDNLIVFCQMPQFCISSKIPVAFNTALKSKSWKEILSPAVVHSNTSTWKVLQH